MRNAKCEMKCGRSKRNRDGRRQFFLAAVMAAVIFGMGAYAVSGRISCAAAQDADADDHVPVKNKMEDGLAASADRVFLDALVDAGLFRLAEEYCRREMNATGVSPQVKAELTMEWMRVVLGQSLTASGAQRQISREKAAQILADFRTQFPESSWLPVVEYQWGLGLLAAAEMACLEGQVHERDREKMEEARKLLRQAIKLFKELDKKLEVIPDDAPRKSTARHSTGGAKAWGVSAARFSEDGLSVWEQVSLRNNIQYRLLLALKCQGESYPPGSVDRVSSATEALKQVQVLFGVPEDSPLRWRIHLAEIACLRLQGNFAEVKKRLETLAGRPMTDETRLDFLAETLRFYLATGRAEAALELVRQEFSPEMIGLSGNADCAVLEMQIALWMTAVKKGEAGKKEAQQWYTETLMMREQIRAKDSPQWVYRAEILLSGLLKEAVQTQGVAGEDLGVLLLMVENACRAGDLKKALPLCEQAWRKAVAEKNMQVAVRVGTLAAGILYQEGNHDAAMRFYRRTATAFPEHPDAVKNHLLAIFLASEKVNDALRNARNFMEQTRMAGSNAAVSSVNEAQAGMGGAAAAEEEADAGEGADLEENGRAEEALHEEASREAEDENAADEAVHKTAERDETALESASPEGTPVTEEQTLMAELTAAMDIYEELLVEHYRLWKDTDPAITNILKQLVELLRLRGKWAAAVDISRILVESTDAEDPEYFARVQGAVHAWNALFQDVQKSQAAAENLPKFARQAVTWSETVLKNIPAGAPRYEMMVHSARWRLEFLPETAAQAERTLREVLSAKDASGKTISAEMRVSAQCLLILATVMQGRSDEVSQLLAGIVTHTGQGGSASENTAALLAILKSLQRFSKTATDEKMARQYAQLQLTVVELLEKHADALPPAGRNELMLGKAQTLLTLGRTEDALPLYAQIAAVYPKSREVQTEYARVLSVCGEKTKLIETLNKARDQWRAVEKNSTPKTEPWFAAKYEVLRLYILLGEKEQAQRMYETLRVLYPELGGKQMRRKFEKLFP